MTDFLRVAEALKPQVKSKAVGPVRRIAVRADSSGFQGWAADAVKGEILPAELAGGDSFVLDFGEHQVGYLAFSLVLTQGACDSPVRLKLTFGETLGELDGAVDLGSALSLAWMQDETITVDLVPSNVRLPRRYAFRYIKVEVVTKSHYRFAMRDVVCHTVTSGDEANVPALPAKASQEVRKLDEVSLRTLRQCMQTVFEDGPKRDRRLWLGDLRLQARLNYLSFKQYDLVKRCLYLFAGLRAEDGIANADMYEFPTPHRGGCRILDYAALLGPTVLDYAEASDDWDAAGELWPVVKDQLKLLEFVKDGVFADPGNWWLFIDWQEKLHKQAPVHGVLVYGLRETLKLAQRLGVEKEVAHLPAAIEGMVAGGRKAFWDSEAKVVTSGGQASYASLAWFALAGILTPEEARGAFAAIGGLKNAVPPGGPYLYHHVVEAMLLCGLRKEAWEIVRTYWGGMLSRGGTTFFEVWDPSDEKRSPYGNYRINSYCHAWSCTAAWFIRKHGLGIS